MTQIKVSAENAKAFQHLKDELKKIYPEKKITDDEVMGAMIGGFFDSLQHIQQHSHHHHGDHECCGGGACGGECE